MTAAGRRILLQPLQCGPTAAIGIADGRGQRPPTRDRGPQHLEFPVEFPEASPNRPGSPGPIHGAGAGLQSLLETSDQGVPRPSRNARTGLSRQQGQALKPRPCIASLGQVSGAAVQRAAPFSKVPPARPGLNQLHQGPHPFEFPPHPMDGRIIERLRHPGTGMAGPFAEQSRKRGLGRFPGGNEERHARNLGHGGRDCRVGRHPPPH